jgi:DNA-binding protein HU-beta
MSWSPAVAGESIRRSVAERIEKKEFVRRLAERMQTDEATATQWLDSTLEKMYQTFRSGCGLTLPGFGGFYLDRRRESWAFKFNPGQKLRALFGWSSSYRGPL